MPLAYSGGPNIYRTFTPATRPEVFNGVVNALLAAQWSNIGTSAIATGVRLRAVSPQSLMVDVDIWDPGSGDAIGIQFSHPTGRIHVLRYGEQKQIVANKCQFFISTVNQNSPFDGRVVCGGIPYIPDVGGGADPVCGSVGVNGDATTNCWWSDGDFQGSAFGIACQNFRQFLGATGVDTEGFYNGVYSVGSGPSAGPVILAFAYSNDDGTPILYPDKAPLIIEPLIAWGDTSGSDPLRVRGQIWDAMIVTENRLLEDTTSIFGTKSYEQLEQNFTWRNFIDNYVWGSLFLITGGFRPGAGVNQSYTY